MVDAPDDVDGHACGGIGVNGASAWGVTPDGEAGGVIQEVDLSCCGHADFSVKMNASFRKGRGESQEGEQGASGAVGKDVVFDRVVFHRFLNRVQRQLSVERTPGLVLCKFPQRFFRSKGGESLLDLMRQAGQSGRVTRFRPCIDLHDGSVKQIVGGSLTQDEASLCTNFVSDRGAAWYADLYRRDGLRGGHVIKLGPGNDRAAREALAAWPGGLQVGGGIVPENAEEWISAGASHVIVTSCLFDADGRFLQGRLKDLVSAVGAERLVLDLSCRRVCDGWAVAMNRWQTLTELRVTADTLDMLAEYCAEFLIHAADVEGLCTGIDRDLVEMLGRWRRLPMTYAGGISHIRDFDEIDALSGGAIDATVGSALDLFGGGLIRYGDLVARQRAESGTETA